MQIWRQIARLLFFFVTRRDRGARVDEQRLNIVLARRQNVKTPRNRDATRAAFLISLFYNAAAVRELDNLSVDRRQSRGDFVWRLRLARKKAARREAFAARGLTR